MGHSPAPRLLKLRTVTLIDPDEALLVLRKWREEETPLRVVAGLATLHLNTDATIADATILRFGLKLSGANNFFELDFDSSVFEFGHDPEAPDRTALVCVRPDGRITFFDSQE